MAQGRRAAMITLTGALALVGTTVVTLAVIEQRPAEAARQETAVSTAFTGTFGYTIAVPGGWRRSTALSYTNGSGDKIGQDVFTVRTADDELAQLKSHGELPGPAWHYTLIVEVKSNRQGLSPVAYAKDPYWGEWSSAQVVEAITLDGRPAAKKTAGPRFSVAYYVPVGSRMYVLGYNVRFEKWRPAAATTAILDGMAHSFHVLP